MSRTDNREYLVDRQWLIIATVLFGAGLLLLSLFCAPSHEVAAESQTFAYRWLMQYVTASSIYGRLIAFALVALVAFTLYMMNRKSLFMRKETLLPCFLFIFLMGISPYGYILSPGLISVIILLPAIYNFIALQGGDERVTEASKALMYTSLASWFNESCLWFVLVFLIMLIVFNKLTPRILAASIIGASFPFLILAQYCYLFDKMDIFTEFFSRFMLDVFPRINEPIEYPAMYIIFGIVLVMSFLAYMGHSIHDKAEQRHVVFFFYLFLVISILLYYIYPEAPMQQNPVVFLMATIVMSHYFTTNTGKIAGISLFMVTIPTFLLYLKYLFI